LPIEDGLSSKRQGSNTVKQAGLINFSDMGGTRLSAHAVTVFAPSPGSLSPKTSIRLLSPCTRRPALNNSRKSITRSFHTCTTKARCQENCFLRVSSICILQFQHFNITDSFISQTHHRIHPRSTPRRHIRRYDRHDKQRRRASAERHRVYWLDPV